MYGLRYLVFCSMCILSSLSLAFGAQPRTPREAIGEGVHVRVHAYYDSAFARNKSKEELTKHFGNIFQTVQGEFFKRFINVTFEVKESEQKESLEVYDNVTEEVNGNATLKNLKEEAEKEVPESYNSIYYFFTGNDIFTNKTMQSDGLYTPRTFCTTNGTAAVLQSMARSEFWMTPFKLTSLMFGSTRSPPRDEDYPKMNETFRKCTHSPTREMLH
uniref:28 kDa Metastriate family member n=1 Tax=Rhipicephalus appendiculatus TaxID=34631 RepID=A0A131YHN9_RHIAP